jgi:ATP-binding cassette, subfamily B, bacterial
MSDLALYGRLLRQARPYWLHLASLFAVGLLASPIALLTPVPLKIAVDSVLGSRPLPPFVRDLLPTAVALSPGALLSLAVGLLLSIAALGQLQALANKFMQAYVGERLVLGLRTQLVHQAQRLSLSYHDSKGAADSLYRIQQDAAAIDKIMVEGIIPFITAAITLGTMIVVIVRLDWVLAIVALAVCPPLFALSRRYRPRMRRQSRQIKKLESFALAVVQETLGALAVVKAFGQEARETDRFARRSSEGVAARIRLALMEGRYGMLVGVTSALGTGAVLLIAVQHVRADLLSLGQLLMVLTYLGQLYEPLKTISKKAAGIQSYLASAERAFALLDEQPEVPERPDARPLARAHGAVAFRGVSFAYGPDRPVLHDVSFEVAPGTRLGIAGATGAGKTTLISLLTRFYDPTAGEILLDGVDLQDYRLDDLRRQFAVVLQDPVLFSTSIAENIAYAAPGATREQIVAAAQASNAHEFVERLPQGYETQVGDRGVKLSGGQRQRIALARAFLKDSPVLILDEPTSSVDAQTESAIVEALERLKRGRTVIIISHRPSTLAGCSAVLLIDNGRVVADTAHALAERRRVSAPPRRALAPGVSEKYREKLLAHPAVQAWCRLGPDRPVPDRIAPTKSKPYKRETPVYRLEGAGPDATAVIAKACRSADAVVERTVYERYLPRLEVPTARYYGCVEGPDDGLTWLFLGELLGEEYSNLLPQHRGYAARWLGALHAGAQAVGPQDGLPEGGPGRYLEHLRQARQHICAHIDNPVLGTDDRKFLATLLSLFDELEEHWDRLVEACAGMPRTLVHGDFSAKNVRVQAAAPTPGVVAFDWEDAGWGVPAADLAQLALTSSRISTSPDLETYLAAVRERWPACQRVDIERVANCGSVFRSLAALRWDSHHLAHEWAQWFIRSLQLYDAELAHALGRLDWRRPVPPPRVVVGT